MRQIGRIISINDNIAEISVLRNSSCGENCASCSSNCSMKKCHISANAITGVDIGDLVVFEMPSNKVFLAAFLAYIMPLFVLMISFLIASQLGANEGLSFGISIFAMILWFFVVRLIDSKLKIKYTHSIVGKVDEENN